MKSPASDIAEILQQLEYGTLGTNLFIGFLPDTPDECIAVISSTGRDPEFSTTITGGFELIYRPNVQILLRVLANNYEEGYGEILQIFNNLNGKISFEINNSRYSSSIAIGDIAELGYDKNKRALFSVNFRLERGVKTL